MTPPSRRDIERRLDDLADAFAPEDAVAQLSTERLYIECLKRGQDGAEPAVDGDAACDEYMRRLRAQHGEAADTEGGA